MLCVLDYSLAACSLALFTVNIVDRTVDKLKKKKIPSQKTLQNYLGASYQFGSDMLSVEYMVFLIKYIEKLMQFRMVCGYLTLH